MFLSAEINERKVVRPYTPISPPGQRGTFDLLIKARGESLLLPIHHSPSVLPGKEGNNKCGRRFPGLPGVFRRGEPEVPCRRAHVAVPGRAAPGRERGARPRTPGADTDTATDTDTPTRRRTPVVQTTSRTEAGTNARPYHFLLRRRARRVTSSTWAGASSQSTTAPCARAASGSSPAARGSRPSSRL